jgi:hypothetical protein
MVGVMVDLGWPWWVTTITAVCVVMAAAAAYVVAHDPAVRAVAAVLAVEGIAIAVIAPFVMDENSSAATTAMHAQRSLTRQEFARRADANCTAVQRAFAAAGNPQTPAAIGAKLGRLMPAFIHGLARQGMLVPPPSERETAHRWMNAMAAFGANLEALGRAARESDTKGVQTAGARVATSAARSAALSKQLDLKVCFS